MCCLPLCFAACSRFAKAACRCQMLPFSLSFPVIAAFCPHLFYSLLACNTPHVPAPPPLHAVLSTAHCCSPPTPSGFLPVPPAAHTGHSEQFYCTQPAQIAKKLRPFCTQILCPNSHAAISAGNDHQICDRGLNTQVIYSIL